MFNYKRIMKLKKEKEELLKKQQSDSGVTEYNDSTTEVEEKPKKKKDKNKLRKELIDKAVNRYILTSLEEEEEEFKQQYAEKERVKQFIKNKPSRISQIVSSGSKFEPQPPLNLNYPSEEEQKERPKPARGHYEPGDTSGIFTDSVPYIKTTKAVQKGMTEIYKWVLGLGGAGLTGAGLAVGYDRFIKNPSRTFGWFMPGVIKMKEDYDPKDRVEPNYNFVMKHFSHARVSQASYDESGKRHNYGTLRYNRELSNQKIATYHTTRGHFIIGFQGTKLLSDWHKNLKQAVGFHLDSWMSHYISDKLGIKPSGDFKIFDNFSDEEGWTPDEDILNLQNQIKKVYDFAYNTPKSSRYKFNPKNIRIDLTGHSRGGAVVRAVLLDPSKFQELGGKRISELVTQSHIYNPAVFADSNYDKFLISLNKQGPNTVPKERLKDSNIEKIHEEILKEKSKGETEYQTHLNDVNKKLFSHRSEFDLVSYGYDFVENQVGHRLHYNFTEVDSPLDWYKAHQMENWLNMFELDEPSNVNFSDMPNPFDYPVDEN